MKKIILTLILITSSCAAFSLKGSVEQEYIPKGFFGSWVVVSKLNSTNNPSLFNSLSQDIWTLSGHDKILVLENKATGARSEIHIKEKPKESKDGSVLKFKRVKKVNKDNTKIVFRETVSFVLIQDKFKGTDSYVVEKHRNGRMIEKSEASYSIGGVKIPDS